MRKKWFNVLYLVAWCVVGGSAWASSEPNVSEAISLGSTRVQDNTQPSLLELVKSGSIEKVRDFLGSGHDIDSRSDSGQTLLIYATSLNNLSLVEFLVESGANINAQDIKGNAPIHYASHFNYFPILKFLLERKCDINLQNNFNQTGLLLSVFGKFNESLSAHLAFGASPDAADIDGITALMHCIYKKNKEGISLLLSYNAKATGYTKKNETILTIPCVQNHPNVLICWAKQFLKYPEWPKYMTHAVKSAIKNNNLEAVKVIASMPFFTFDAIIDGETFLGVAIRNNNIPLLTYLVTSNINCYETNSEGMSPLMLAAKLNNEDAVKVLINKNINPFFASRAGLTAKVYASTPALKHLLGAYEIDFLISSGYFKFINKTSHGSTLLQQAVLNQDLDSIQRILYFYPDLSVKDKTGKTVLDLLPTKSKIRKNQISNVQKEMVRLFDDYNDRLNSSGNVTISSPVAIKHQESHEVEEVMQPKLSRFKLPDPQNIHQAARFGNLKAVEIFLKSGVNINDRDTNGCTPLYLAVRDNHEALGLFLLQNGANPYIFPENEESTQDLMWRWGQFKLIKYITGSEGMLAPKSLDKFHDTRNQNGKTPFVLFLEETLREGSSTKSNNRKRFLFIQSMAEKGANVNNADSFGFTPLMRAAEADNLSMMYYLYGILEAKICIAKDELSGPENHIRNNEGLSTLDFLNEDKQKDFLSFMKFCAEVRSSTSFDDKSWSQVTFDGELDPNMYCPLTGFPMNSPIQIWGREGELTSFEFKALLREMILGQWVNPLTRQPVNLDFISRNDELQKKIKSKILKNVEGFKSKGKGNTLP